MTTAAAGPVSDPLEWRIFLLGLRCQTVSLVAVFLSCVLTAFLGFSGPLIYYEMAELRGVVAAIVYTLLVVPFFGGLGCCCQAPSSFPGKRCAQAAFGLALAGVLLFGVVFVLTQVPAVLWVWVGAVMSPTLFHNVFMLMIALTWLLAAVMSLAVVVHVGRHFDEPPLVRSALGCTKWFVVWACSMAAAVWLPRDGMPADRALMHLYFVWTIGLAAVVHVWWTMLLHQATICVAKKGATA